MKKRRVIVWFRNDLRLHDNEALTDALRSADEVVPVFVFDTRLFLGKTRYGFPKTGPHRANFVLESIQDLRQRLRDRGSDLYVRVGHPEEILPEMARELKTAWVFCNRERTEEEVNVQDRLERKLWEIGQEVRYSRGKMLYYTADLPFPVTHTPDLFSHFRKEVEKYVEIREPLPTPTAADFHPISVALSPGELPSMTDFGHDEPYRRDPRAVLGFEGGETAGLARLQHFLWVSDAIQEYRETRNSLLGADYSSKLSAYLAQGCLSPKMIYAELKRYEAERVKNKSTYWLFFELMWRDFFRLMGKKYGNAIFKKGGPKRESHPEWQDDEQLFHCWAEGRTGIPFVDANMRELAATGFMSNRGRQNVASFLVRDLHVNWQMGAEWFESLLVDYDPCSNWGNWNYVAGVGSDTREDRYFNILKQAQRHDPKGEYIKCWCPELAALPVDLVHQPDEMSPAEQSKYGLKLGADYPRAMVRTAKWA